MASDSSTEMINQDSNNIDNIENVPKDIIRFCK